MAQGNRIIKTSHRPSWPDDLALTILVTPVYDYWQRNRAQIKTMPKWRQFNDTIF
jgi:hypothetical protein